jgi:hypothetical protein
MSEIVLNALTKRRAELMGEDTALRAKLAQIRADIGHLDAVIRQFDPDYNLASIRGKRPRNREAARRGETSRAVLGLLREAKTPISTAEVVERMMAQRGVDTDDRQAVKLMLKRTGTTLARQEKQGTVRSVREPGQAVEWEVTG